MHWSSLCADAVADGRFSASGSCATIVVGPSSAKFRSLGTATGASRAMQSQALATELLQIGVVVGMPLSRLIPYSVQASGGQHVSGEQCWPAYNSSSQFSN